MSTSSPEPTQDQNGLQHIDLSPEEQQRLEDLHLYVLDGLVTPETADSLYTDPPRREGQS
jgi:hypothetical protein